MMVNHESTSAIRFILQATESQRGDVYLNVIARFMNTDIC